MSGGWIAKGNADFALRSGRGVIHGYSAYVWRAHNPDVDTAAPEDVVEWGGSVQYLASAETLDIVSDSTDDDVGGTGVTAVQVVGIDANGFELTEVVAMDGTTPVVTTGSFLRVNQMTAATCGTGGKNAGTILATATVTGYTLSEIDTGDGISHSGVYTVPLGQRASFMGADFSVIKASGTNPVVEIIVWVRTSAAGPWLNLFDTEIDTAIHNFITFEAQNKASFGPGVEARVEASTSSNNTNVRGRLYLTLGPDE